LTTALDDHQLNEAPVIRDVVPGKMLKFADAQTRVSQKNDYVPLLWLADIQDLLIFLVIKHPHFGRVLSEHLDFEGWIRDIVIFGQPAAETFQNCKMGVCCPVFIIIFQNMCDVIIDMFGLEIGSINRGKFGEPSDNHFVMDLSSWFKTLDIS